MQQPTPRTQPQPLSCTACRSRKVKCDHKKPVCSGCDKYGGDCVWPERKKNTTRREKKLYANIVDRLAQMERFVKDLQEPPPQAPLPPPPQTHRTHTAASESRKGPDRARRRSTDQQAAGAGAAPTQPSPTTLLLPPSPAASEPRAKPYYSGAVSEATVSTSGSCSLFSAEGIAKIDGLVGDNRFSDAVRALLERIRSLAPQRSLDFASCSSQDYPFPPNDIIMTCMNEFFQTLNHDIRLFQESEVRAAVLPYLYGQPPKQPGWRMALNVIISHALRIRQWKSNSREWEKYLYNALGLIPNAILQTPNPMTIGALLSIVDHFIFMAENHIAVSILALTTQLILLAGYHNPDHPPGQPAEAALHRRRLFWQAYILDHNLMLRIGKPPLISDELLLDMPEEVPPDHYGVFYYPGDVRLSFFYQELRLSRIQGRICSKLYFNRRGGGGGGGAEGGMTTMTTTSPSAAALEAEIALLDAELQDWREGIPDMTMTQSAAPAPAEQSRLISLSVLHFVYFQMVVAVHSAAFRLPLLADEDAEGLRPSVALCVNAARAALSLLNYHRRDHPFTIYLLYQVAWSVDILFVNMLEDRASPTSAQDLELIEMVVSFFERYDANHRRVATYHIIKALYEVASSVLGSSGSGSTPAGGGGGGPAAAAAASATSTSSSSQMTTPPTTATTVLAEQQQQQPCPSAGMAGVGGGGAEVPAMLPLSDAELVGGWRDLSFGNHDWLSAGFLQMTDWGVAASVGPGFEWVDAAAADEGAEL